MKIEDIKQLVDLMVANDLSELDVTDGQTKILLKRGPSGVPVVSAAPAQAAVAAAAPAASPAQEPEGGLVDVRSPMVGTFYSASSPDSEPFVSVGSSVDAESVVCLIEAMKVMNEIKAECSGTIQQICVKNAQPVEFGQVLFRVKPN